jgi:hypothetical protein
VESEVIQELRKTLPPDHPLLELTDPGQSDSEFLSPTKGASRLSKTLVLLNKYPQEVKKLVEYGVGVFGKAQPDEPVGSLNLLRPK